MLNYSSNPHLWRLCAIPLLLAPRKSVAQSGSVVNILIFRQKSLCAKCLRGRDGHFPLSFACSSGERPGSGGVRKCCHGEFGRFWHYFYDHEFHVPISTSALPFCPQSVKSELQLAHMQEVQTVISDKPTYHIQDVYGSSLKSVLQSQSGGKHWG